tara:strand:+ start:1051 stop:1704 length:654 start_codon:yes stop_codon:yes gene_type:complete
VRIAGIILVAILINMGLYLLMENMISKDNVRVIDLLDTQAIEFVRTFQDEDTRSRDRRRPAPPKPQNIERPRAEVENIANRASAVSGDFDAFQVTSLLSAGASSGGGIGIGQSLIADSVGGIDLMSANDLIPMTMLPPQYPPSALLRKTEGWVELVFTVTAEGAVVNPEVTASYPEGEFERAAIAAAKRWRFRPVVRDGVATQIAAQIHIDFTLANR